MPSEELSKLTKKELEECINERLAHVEEVWPDERGTALAEAEVYMRTLERRQDSHDSKRDFVLDLVILFLIGMEIFMSIRAELLQRENFKDEGKIFEKLQESSDKTATNVSLVEIALNKMNKNLQLELDLYYEPSVHVASSSQDGFDALEVHNQGRTAITVLGVKAWDVSKMKYTVCMFRAPAAVPSGLFKDLGSEFIMRNVVQSVLTVGGSRPFDLFFRTGNGKEFRHRVLVVRGPLIKRKQFAVSDLEIEPIVWSRELAKTPPGKCSD